MELIELNRICFTKSALNHHLIRSTMHKTKQGPVDEQVFTMENKMMSS